MKSVYNLLLLLCASILFIGCKSDLETNKDILNGEWDITSVRYIRYKESKVSLDSTVNYSSKPLGKYYFNSQNNDGWYYFNVNSDNKDKFSWSTNIFRNITSINFQIKNPKNIKSFMSLGSGANVSDCEGNCFILELDSIRFNNANGFDGTTKVNINSSNFYPKVFITIKKL